MSRNTDLFYTPYLSDNTDSDSDSDTIDPRYAIIKAAGQNMDTSAQQLKYMQHLPGAEYTPNTNIKSLSTLTYLNPPKTTATTLYCIKSSDRDKSIYPSPYNFQLKLPKVYKNVTKVQILQLSFPYNIGSAKSYSLVSTFSSFISSKGYNMSCISSCLNIFTNSSTKANSFTLMEQGRFINGNQLLTKLEIPIGQFNNSQIASQLTAESNNTPPFNIINYNHFKKIFTITRDIKILFNEPGDNYHSKLTTKVYTQHTKENIMNTYYTQHDIDKHPIITDVIALNAYYYPILKELLITELGPYFINTEIDTEQLKYYVIKTFLGLDSQLYYTLCLDNQIILDEYRKNLTFEYRNINKYNWGYDTISKQFNSVHDTLHTSLRTDITNSLNKCISDELMIHSLTTGSYQTLKTDNNNNNTILDHLTSYVSTIFSSYFLEDYNYINNLHSNRTATYLHNNTHFTNMFRFTNVFGNQYGTFSGKKFSFTNFIDYHSTLSSYTNIVQSTNNSISSIYGNICDKHHLYISSKYTNIFPDDIIQNKLYVNVQSLPVAFMNNTLNVGGMYQSDTCVSECYNYINNELNKYYSNLPVNTVINTLDYKLGLSNTSNITFNTLNTFFNTVSINHYNYYLQINPEMSFNNVDIAMSEDYNVTNETTGQTKLMFAKILTGGVGSNELSQTCIQNPIVFPNTLGKLDRMTFKIYLDDQTITPMWLFHPFFEQRDEWSATFQIDEEIGYADRNAGWGSNPTIEIPNNPNSFSYMGLTKIVENPK